jgi:hypothetical protein
VFGASPAEIAAVAVVLAIATWVAARAARGQRAGLVVIAVAGVAIAVNIALRSTPAPAAPPPATPRASTMAGYVTSAACLPCHPGEHASFDRSYHRTMTRVASPATIRAPLDGRPLDLDGRTIRLERRDAEVWATLPDPDDVIAGRSAPDITRRVVLTTGSHREQAYWVEGKRRGDLRLVPFVWLVEDEAFVPRREAFILPPGEPMPPVRWGSSCIACHSVAGEPRHDLETDSFDTRAAELGIACEACHGPGAAHVARHRDPFARYAQHASNASDATIIQPARLSPERSAAVCGQCHAYAFPRDPEGFWTDGYSRTFRAGDALEPSRTLLTPRTLAGKHSPVSDADPNAIFWPDGAVRVGGREYNGLVASPCFERGSGERKMTCTSCHSMHRGDPAGQVAPERIGDRACTDCHSDARARNHSNHLADSPGSACVSCHMPKTSYALLSAVRSHRIESPNVARALASGKPNACNLCHLDRSLAWTAKRMAEWYGADVPAMSEERARTATSVHDGLAGDAGVRALVADALGSKDAIAAAGTDFQAALLEEMLRDPYAAVRFIAQRSIRKLRAAPARPHPRSPDDIDTLAVDSSGHLDPERLRALLAARDERAITIAE